MAAQVRGAVQVRFAAQVTGRVTVQLGVAAQVEAQVGGGSGTGYRARRGLCTGMPGSSLVRWLFIWSFALLFRTKARNRTDLQQPLQPKRPVS